MSDIYIVGFDGTEQSRRAGEFAAETAKKSGAKLHVFMVLEWSPYSFHTPEELAERKGRREEELKRAEADVQPFADKLKKTGVEVSTEVHHGNAGDLLCQSAKDKDAVFAECGKAARQGTRDWYWTAKAIDQFETGNWIEFWFEFDSGSDTAQVVARMQPWDGSNTAQGVAGTEVGDAMQQEQ